MVYNPKQPKAYPSKLSCLYKKKTSELCIKSIRINRKLDWQRFLFELVEIHPGIQFFFIYLYVYLFIYLFIFLFIFLFIYLFVYLFICLLYLT